MRDEHKTAFFGEDLYIDVPARELGEVVFKPRTNHSLDVVLLKAGRVVSHPPGPLSGPEIHLTSPGHVILENLQEKDEGVYVIRNANTSTEVKRLIVVVRGKSHVKLCTGMSVIKCVCLEGFFFCL